MAKVEKHPSDPNKYRCPSCEYGHEKPKSRQAVYKHYNNVHKTQEPIIIEEQQGEDFFDLPDNNVEPSETSEIDTEWESISWMEAEEHEDVTPHTIPDPIANMAGGDGKQLLIAHRVM
mgnify:CR=1 FL=1